MARYYFASIYKLIIWLFMLYSHESLTTALSDNRCFLETGAASETFFVAEDLPLGATVGRLTIHGDPTPGGGSVLLRLQDDADGVLALAPGTATLTLRRPLDREGVAGPASASARVACERLGVEGGEPPLVVPVHVRVTDVNDNAPVFVDAPYALNISEVTVVGTRVLRGVHAVDLDQEGPFSTVRYEVLPGPHSDHFEFENELEGTLVLRRPLDYERLRRFDVPIRAQDHGEPPLTADTVLTVHVVDADDQNPKFLDDRYTSVIPEPPKKGSILVIRPRDIESVDQDVGINAPVFYTFNEVGPEYAFFRLNRLTAKVSLAMDLGEDDLPHPVTLVVRATQQDNADRYALATLTVSRNPAKGIRFLHSTFYIRASESLPPGALIGTLSNNRPGEQLRYFVSDQAVLKTFSLNTRGELSLRKKLDYEERAEYYFKVFATDGVTNDSSVVNVTVEDVNEWEPRFRYPNYEFFIAGRPEELLGRIEAADGDKNDRLTLSLSGVNASLFTISQNGELRLRDPKGFQGVANLAVIATDNGTPPKTATVPVSVHFTDTGDHSEIISSRKNGGAPLILAGLGAILLILVFVVILLVAYICKVKRNPGRPAPTLQPESREKCPQKVPNPVFGDRSPRRPPTASAIGGIPSDLKSRLPSPKVHPAPQPPPAWPPSEGSTRVKKLSWGDDKTDAESSEHVNGADSTPKLLSNTNLTVYF